MFEIAKIKKDINWLIEKIKCLLNKSELTTALSALEWSPNHSVSIGNSYLIGDFVWLEGIIYESKIDNNNYPPTNANYWVNLGEGHRLVEEPSNWNTSSGRGSILNKPTSTSEFENNGEDGSSPYATQEYVDNAIPLTPNLEQVLTQGDTAEENNVNIKKIGLYDNYNSEVVTPGFARVFAENFAIIFENKFAERIFSLKKNLFSFIQNSYSFGISIPTLSGNRTATLQNKSGVIAYLSDVLEVTTNLYAQTSLSTPIVYASGETSLIGSGVGSLLVPANTFKVGDSFVAKMCGQLTCANNEVLHIHIKSNGVIIIDALDYTMPATTNKYWDLILDFTVTKIGGATVAELFANGTFTYNKNASNAIDGIHFGQVSNTVFNTTIDNTLTITAQWITNNAANTIRSQNFTLTKV